MVSPFASAAFASPSTYGSGSPKPEAGPVSGLTKPILIVWSAWETRGAAQTWGAAAPETARPPAPIPARLSSSRLEMPLPSAIRSSWGVEIDHPRAAQRYDAPIPVVKTLFRLLERRRPSTSLARQSGLSQSLERGLAILSAFSSARPLLGVSDLAREVGLSRSSAHRYIATLAALGYLEQDRATRRYRLGPRVLDLGFSAINSMELRAARVRRPPGPLGRDRATR